MFRRLIMVIFRLYMKYVLISYTKPALSISCTTWRWPLSSAETCSFTLCKGKAVPLQTWAGPEVSRKLRFPDYLTMVQDGGKVVSLTHRPPLPPVNTPGTHFCSRLSRAQGHSAIGRILCKWKIHWHQLGSNQRPSDLCYRGPPLPYVDKTLYSTNKHICVRPVHTLYISQTSKHPVH